MDFDEEKVEMASLSRGKEDKKGLEGKSGTLLLFGPWNVGMNLCTRIKC